LLNILLVNKFLHPRGGDAAATLSTGRLLEQRGHRVTHWGMASTLNPPFEYQETFVPHVDLNDDSTPADWLRIAANLLYSWDAKRRIDQVVLRAKPDLVHLHNFAHQISPSILHVLRKHRIPCVMTMHDYKLVCASYSLLSKGSPCERCRGGRYYHCVLQACVKNSRAKSLLNTVEMYLHHGLLDIYNSIRCFIAPSQFLKRKVESMGFKKPVVHLMNFIELQEVALASEVEERSIAYVGRLSPEKGVMTLVKAARLVPDLTVKLIGDGPERAALERAAAAAGMRNVRFLGHLSGEALRGEIRSATCAVLPSECYENNPRAVLEAFALGKPVVGSRIGGIPELVQDDVTGITFAPGDARDLADKLSFAISDGARLARWGASARSFVESACSAETHYRGLMAIYQGAM
jgi:glycosyltransferase involved in cell wall biosynthesis